MWEAVPPSSETVSRGSCATEFPWERVLFTLETSVGLGSSSQPQGRTLVVGGLGQVQPLCSGHWALLTHLESSYRQICLFFPPPHSNFKAMLHSKDAFGISRMDFYVVQ